ncbi:MULTISPECIES: hypothetical protein [Aeromonas]|uniref:hypothetical protein n=1 Tax=Aeromonas TaxID=642 RepID=UPI001C250038|nr:hypothetical protein [Aeromonas sp. FDAARGOS 1407]QXC36137.1 hypothetical protein I6L37_11055 [Aeromonas sp. FDAARGOS 1407]
MSKSWDTHLNLPVWFNCQIVLAPKLYLVEADKRHLSGSVITAGNIDLNEIWDTHLFGNGGGLDWF